MKEILRRTLPQSIQDPLRAVKLQTKKMRWHALSRIHSFDPLDNLIVSSDTRGGSTWLAETLAHTPQTVKLFEPLHLQRRSPFTDLNFSWRQHIPEDADWPEAYNAFEKLFRGKLLPYFENASPAELMKAKRMVIKFCRAKALLPWLVKHFAFNYPPVNLLRHPGAVVASQRHASFKFPGWSDEGFRGFVIPDGPYNHFYTQHADFLETITTKEEQLTATWCMTNQVPLTHRRNNEAWINVYYEDLLFEAETEIERIFQTWGLPVPQGILEELRKPSTSAIDTTFRQSAEAQVYKWQRSFSPEQKARMQEILDYFGVEVYHMDDVMPNKP